MSRNLKVFVLTNTIPPYYLGVFEHLHRFFANLRVLVSTPVESDRDWVAAWGDVPVTVQKCWTYNAYTRYEQGLSQRVLRHVPYDTLPLLLRHRPSIVISLQLGYRSLQAALYRKLCPKSRLIIWLGLSQHTEKVLPQWRVLQRKMLLRAADAVLVNGASGVRYLEGLGVAREKIFLHPYCAEIAPNLEIPLEREPNVSRRFLYVGRLIELKGLIPFLKALSEWLRNHPENKCEFWIAGDGPIRAELEAYPIPPQLQVRFLGSIGYDNLPGVYAQAGILAFPTLGDEWGVVVNEALAAGVPVLGSLYSQAVEELVRDDVNGWTFWTDHPGEMYSAIDRAMNTQNQALEEMRYAGREYIRKFSPEYGAKCFVKAIDFVERPITTARLAHPASNATSAISTVMKTCPLCKREVIRRFELGHTIVYQCAAAGCRLLFSDPQLDDSELARAYERHYYPSTGNGNGNGNGNKSIYENTPEEILIQTFERLNSQFGPLAGKNLLDYGCGIGRLCQIASRYGARATGIESDGNARKKVMQIGGIEVFENLNELRHVQPRAKFDIVTLWDVIEHLRKPWIELEELFNFLKPGGLLLLSTMNTGCLRARIERGRWVNMVNPTHFYYFTRQSLSAVLEEAGFGHITELPVSIDYPQHGPVQRMFNRVLKSCHLQGQLIYTAQREPAERTERLRANV